MFEYEIYYLVDHEVEIEIESEEIEADSIEALFERIRSIEKNNTIVSIKNKLFF